MKLATGIVILLFSGAIVQGNNTDLFNYGMQNRNENGNRSFGQRNWDDVTCSNFDTCSGFPGKYPFMDGYSQLRTRGRSRCEFCPEDRSRNCGLHRQSPIDLKRDRAVEGHRNEKECPDWHWMQYRDDTCAWDDMKDQFTIERHALQIHVPQLNNGDIACFSKNKRRYPRLDYSKGFPDWWWMQRTDVMVPSQHTQEGTRYAAEVTLAHFYEINHSKNQLGHISIFMQDYPDAESWAYLDKLICAWRKVEEETRRNCGLPPAEPYGRCQLFRGQDPTPEWMAEAGLGDLPPTAKPTSSPTESPTDTPPLAPLDTTKSPVTSPVTQPTSSPVDPPTASPVESPVGGRGPPPPITCGGGSMQRMCDSNDPCCESKRADTPFCWNIYDNVFPGEQIKSACYHCCAQPKMVGDPTPVDPAIPKTIECSAVDNPFRICKAGGCCEQTRSRSRHCQDIYRDFADHIESICYYCCREPKRVAGRRQLELEGSVSEDEDLYEKSVNEEAEEDFVPVEKVEEDFVPNEAVDESFVSDEEVDENFVPEGAKVIYTGGKKFLLREENFEEEEEDEHEYFHRMYSDFKQRNLQTAIHEENYDDIPWFPYEWMIKVGTEYYFRYEGTMLHPPCWEVVHWRNMKDPIRVHPRQIKELNRLLAWRRDPDSCRVDTAGDLSDNGNKVDLSRATQYYHSLHRKVFCECKDWPSKFEGDKLWCRNYKRDTSYSRFYERPYSFNSGGKWHPYDP